MYSRGDKLKQQNIWAISAVGFVFLAFMLLVSKVITICDVPAAPLDMYQLANSGATCKNGVPLNLYLPSAIFLTITPLLLAIGSLFLALRTKRMESN